MHRRADASGHDWDWREVARLFWVVWVHLLPRDVEVEEILERFDVARWSNASECRRWMRTAFPRFWSEIPQDAKEAFAWALEHAFGCEKSRWVRHPGAPSKRQLTARQINAAIDVIFFPQRGMRQPKLVRRAKVISIRRRELGAEATAPICTASDRRTAAPPGPQEAEAQQPAGGPAND
jgi:hypothetical protein